MTTPRGQTDARRAYLRTWRAKNAVVIHEKDRASRRVRQALAIQLKAGGCVDCGNRDLRVLEFDHVRGTKVAAIARLVSQYCSLVRFRAEIAKCEVRCANCHRIRTVGRRGAA